MIYHRVTSGRAWDWTVYGWRLFIRDPGVWIVLYLVYLVIEYGLPLVPTAGPLVLSFIAPALTAGLLFAAREQDCGRPIHVDQLFRAFRDRSVVGRVLVLGLIGLGFKLVSIAVGVASLGGALVAVLTGRLAASALIPALALGGTFGLLVAVTLGLVLAMLLYYAVPLVTFDAAHPIEAIRSSVAACTVNILPLTVLSLINVGLYLVAMLSLGVGIVVVGPITIGSMYAGYKEIYGLSEGADGRV